uniref:Homeobox domain-containing protein n=1 Tax=Ciona savignyi TaxID=51511 RepID=H2ZRD2_CIOSA
MESFSKWFWNDWFWLPEGHSFKNMKPDGRFAQPLDLIYLLGWGVAICCIRKIFEFCFSNKIARVMGVSNKLARPPEIPVLDAQFELTSQPSDAIIAELCKKVDMTQRDVERWFRKRRNFEKPDMVKKLGEASWRFCFYAFVFIYGVVTLHDAPWVWDTEHCWIGYPQTMWKSVYYYYMFEGGFYISLLFTVSTDVRRKDFYEQIIHHISTILLISFSYISNFTRIGSLILIIHDSADVFLELAKCFMYAKNDKWADRFFALFVTSFLFTRLFLFPVFALYPSFVKLRRHMKPWPAYMIMSSVATILQFLHVFWSYLIVKMALRVIVTGQKPKDSRSDDEDSGEDSP